MPEHTPRIGTKALAATAAKAAEVGLATALTAISLNTVAPIAGPILGIVLKELLEQLTAESSRLEAKLDLVLREPMVSACQIVTEVLSVKYQTPEELNERDRRLTVAFDNLVRAYNYTQPDNRDERLLIRMHQALVAALKVGARPFAYLYIKDLSGEALQVRAQAAAMRNEAASIDPTFFETHRSELVDIVFDWDQYYREHEAVDKVIADKTKEKEALTTQAAALESEADNLETLCSLQRN